MISTLPLELSIEMSMVLSEMVMLVYYKVFDMTKSVGTFILASNLCKHCVNRATVAVLNFGTKYAT